MLNHSSYYRSLRDFLLAEIWEKELIWKEY